MRDRRYFFPSNPFRHNDSLHYSIIKYENISAESGDLKTWLPSNSKTKMMEKNQNLILVGMLVNCSLLIICIWFRKLKIVSSLVPIVVFNLLVNSLFLYKDYFLKPTAINYKEKNIDMTLQEFNRLDNTKKLVELWHHGKMINQIGKTRICELHDFLVQVTFDETKNEESVISTLSKLSLNHN